MLSASVMCRGLFIINPGLKQGTLSSEDSPRLFLRFCVIAGLFAASLSSANAALARLEVASVQIIKAIHPAIVYLVGMSCGVERPSWSISLWIAVICGGVMVAVQGALVLEPVGVCLQVVALVADGVRFLYLQATMQACTDALDPVNVLDRVAPIASVFLWAAGSVVEFPSMHLELSEIYVIACLVLCSCILAFGLNLSSYAYIKATSALTVSVSGILRDMMLIGMSVAFYGSSVTVNQCAGYATAIAGTFAYLKCREDQREEIRNDDVPSKLLDQKHSRQ